MNIIDSHCHVGWYSNGYHSTHDVLQILKQSGVSGALVSSTTTCIERYEMAMQELQLMMNDGAECGIAVYPVLWLTPQSIKEHDIVNMLLGSNVKWKCVKQHWGLHDEWMDNAELEESALQVARLLDVPTLFHTGENYSCHAGLFKDVCIKNADLKFILAHGRPLDETKEVLRCCPNSYCDTAFMPVEDVLQLVRDGFEDRILFGTDTPIQSVYYRKAVSRINAKYVNTLRKRLAPEVFDKITNINVTRLCEL